MRPFHGGARRAAALALSLSVCATPALAREVWREGERALSFSGSLRELLSATEGTDPARFAREAQAQPACQAFETFAACPAFDAVGERDAWETLTRLRLQLDAQWGDRFRGQLAYDNEWRGGVPASLFAQPGALPETFLGLEARVGSASSRHAWTHRVYRGWLRYEGERVHLTIGRQRIPWGVARLWNPIDRWGAVDPLALEAEHSPGVDAVELRWLLGDFSSLHAVYAPGLRREDARVALRYQTVWRDLDVALVAGRFGRTRGAGLELSGNLGDAAFSVEAMFTAPRRTPDAFTQFVVSLDHNFELGSGLYVLFEHLYNGNALGLGAGRAGSWLPFFKGPVSARAPLGEPVDPARFGGSRVIGQARHTSGLEFGYELLPTLQGGVLLLWDWDGASAVIAPSVHFGGLNAAELSFGVQFFAGGTRAQYGGPGGPSALGYALVEIFF